MVNSCLDRKEPRGPNGQWQTASCPACCPRSIRTGSNDYERCGRPPVVALVLGGAGDLDPDSGYCIVRVSRPAVRAERVLYPNLNLAVRGLVGLVLLFNVYTIYQQWQIHRIHFELRKQIVAFDRLEDRTEQVYKIAALDCLTGLYNRQSGEQRLAEEISRSQWHARPLTILMLD
jgi:hypothetical protein